jgi:hypothetical protein
MVIVILLGLVAGYFLLWTTPSRLASVQEFDALAHGSRPILVEFYSNI